MNSTNQTKLQTTVLPWLFGPGGAVITLICAWFQTMGFVYVSLSDCLTAVIIGVVLGLVMQLSLYRRSKPKADAPHLRLRLKDLDKIMQGFLLMFPVVSVCGFLATTESAFLIALGAMSFGSAVMTMYIICRKLIIKQENEN